MKGEPEKFDHKAKRVEHMARRYSQHKSLRKVAEEFGVGKSTVHRTLRPTTQDASEDNIDQ